jgi:hypothetical protein
MSFRRTIARAAALSSLAGLASCGGQVDPGAEESDNPFANLFTEQTYGAPPPCGTEEASYNGTPARSNAGDTGTSYSCGGVGPYGLDYQCVELINRYNLTHGLGARIYGNAGFGMCNAARAMGDYLVHYPGSTVKPVPGDALEWENNANSGGHTALVTSTASGSISFLQQNAGTKSSYYPHGTVSWNGSSFGWYGSGLRPVCWIHAKKNGGAPPPAARCFSATLDESVASGTSVQAASDGKWYHCVNGLWYGGETACTTSYPWCASATLGRDVPARSCVHSKFNGNEYQCVAGGAWAMPVNGGVGPIGQCSAMYN